MCSREREDVVVLNTLSLSFLVLNIKITSTVLMAFLNEPMRYALALA